jgi:hypothetical protein
MIIKTRVFELINSSYPLSKYRNLSDLAAAMGLSISQVYRVREGKRGINEKFIIGAKKAFPDCRLDELFYFFPDYTIEIVKRTKVAERRDKTELKSLTS